MRLTPVMDRYARATDLASCIDYFAEGFGRLAGDVDWQRLRLLKSLPHKDGGFLLQYEAPTESGETFHVGGHLTAGPDLKPDWAGATPGTLWNPVLGLALATPETDPRLGKDIGRLSGRVGRQLSEGLGWSEDGLERDGILAYRLAKRCVVRVVDPRGPHRAVVKFARPATVARNASILEALNGEGFPVPALLFRSPGDRYLAMEFLEGRDLNPGDGFPSLEDHRNAGGLLRRLHEAPLRVGEVRTARQEMDQLRLWVPAVTDIFPDLLPGSRSCLEALEAGLPDGPGQPVSIHRDFYDKQVFVTRDGLVLLDFDTICQGDPGLDLGNFMAHIRLRGRQYPAQAEALKRAGEVFLEGYGDPPGAFAGTAWWEAAALLRLVVVYAMRPRWHHLAPSLLEDAHSCLG